MRPVVKRIVAVIVAIALIAAAAVRVGRARFDRRVNDEIATLLASGSGPQPDVVTEGDLRVLPEPVRRWLRWAQVAGKPMPRTVRLRQEGRFRQGEGRSWMAFSAKEVFTTNPPALLWKTTMQMAPGLTIVGRDRYVDGHGRIEMRLLGLIPVAQAWGPAMDQGALLRYLNEIMWFPAAALGPFISWEPIDAHSARATMRFAEAIGEAIFVFDDAGRPVDMVAERQDLARGRRETWSTPLSEYGEFGGVRVPTAGQAIWRYDTGDFAYIDLRITGLEFDLPMR